MKLAHQISAAGLRPLGDQVGDHEAADDHEHEHGIMPGRYQAETQAAVVDIGCLGEMIDDDGPCELGRGDPRSR